jgi:hypothetical protein
LALQKKLKKNNAALKACKCERSEWQGRAQHYEAQAYKLHVALEIACATIPRELLRSGCASNELPVMINLAQKRMNEPVGLIAEFGRCQKNANS